MSWFPQKETETVFLKVRVQSVHCSGRGLQVLRVCERRNGGLDCMLPSHWTSDVTANVGLTASIPPSVSPLSLPLVWECERGPWSLYLSWTADSTDTFQQISGWETNHIHVCLPHVDHTLTSPVSLQLQLHYSDNFFFNLNCFFVDFLENSSVVCWSQVGHTCATDTLD